IDLFLVEEQVAPGSRILEVGSVPLLLTAALTASGHAVQGVDVAPERFASSIADLKLHVTRCDVETEALPFEDGAFDALLFNELLEHLRIDLLFTLREVHRVLRPGGTLLLSTPNLRSFRGLRNLLLLGRAHAVSGGVYAQWQKLERLGHMGHVREYTVRETSELLEQMGFRVEAVMHRGGHGKGLVGLLERLAPSWRPFFSLVARRDDLPPPSRETAAAATTRADGETDGEVNGERVSTANRPSFPSRSPDSDASAEPEFVDLEPNSPP
ncbi:MAG: class I SAM-dependent methyltransferase, partial [Holophagales bacterium]|nr:class I SAM-dependent methyltransferase [Holophagales bacterium]